MQSGVEIAEQARRARQFTEFAYGIAALASLAFAGIIHHGAMPLELSHESSRVMTWSFVGLAAFDTALLLSWSHVCAWLARSH